MKQLTEYSRNGYQFKLIKRVGQFCIFLGTKPDSSCLNYEVVRIRTTKDTTLNFTKPEGEKVEVECHAKEYEPCNNKWGVDGWTYSSLHDAEEKLKALTS